MSPTQTTPQVGEEAPDFTLKDQDRAPVSLRDLRGKPVILVFYPAAFSEVCTAEMCTFRESMAKLNESGAQVLGISVDFPYAQKRWREDHGLEFPLLSDYDRVAIEAYGVGLTGFQGFQTPVAQRAVFVIDGKGIITWEWIAESVRLEPDYDEVLRAAAAS
jgi:glutaredoxin-dependent peroxiredoxin